MIADSLMCLQHAGLCYLMNKMKLISVSEPWSVHREAKYIHGGHVLLQQERVMLFIHTRYNSCVHEISVETFQQFICLKYYARHVLCTHISYGCSKLPTGVKVDLSGQVRRHLHVSTWSIPPVRSTHSQLSTQREGSKTADLLALEKKLQRSELGATFANVIWRLLTNKLIYKSYP